MKISKLLALCALALALVGCSTASPAPTTSASASGSAASTTVPAMSGVSCTYSATSDAAKTVKLPPTTEVSNSGTVQYVMKLNGEALGLTLLRDTAPCTVNSFTSLAAQGFFDATACHRLVTSGIYVLQCGDPSGTGSGGPGYRFDDELAGTETYPAGTLAMANAGANTNGSQFFIVFADSQLSASYTVFGKVDAAGLKVVEAIAAGGTDNSNGSGDGKPKLAAVINSVQPS